MFYCEECRQKEGYPAALGRCWGPCEICARSSMCHDAPSGWLRANKKAPLKAERPLLDVLNDLRDTCHNAAKVKGWYDPPPAEIEAKFVANVHGEVSEFWEAHRKGLLDKPCDKPCGLTSREEEMADILIRVFDMAGYWDVDLDKAVEAKLAYNATRPHRHGGKVA